jgi:adenylate kinase
MMASNTPAAQRTLPNIALSGTPGTGKSTLCTALTAKLPGLRYINISSEAEARGCRANYDTDLQTWEVDEVALARSLRKDLVRGGVLLDWIHADFLAGTDSHDGYDTEEEVEDDNKTVDEEQEVDMIDLVIQMHADTTTLYDRYKARGYGDQKIQENLDCEIMDEIGNENRDAFDKAKCVSLQGVESDMEENVKRILAWVAAWKKDNVD